MWGFRGNTQLASQTEIDFLRDFFGDPTSSSRDDVIGLVCSFVPIVILCVAVVRQSK